MSRPTTTRADTAITGNATGSLTTGLDQIFGGDFGQLFQQLMDFFRQFLNGSGFAQLLGAPAAAAEMPSEEMSQTITEVVAPEGEGFENFEDFVSRNNYQSGPQWDEESMHQAPDMQHGGDQHAEAYAMAVAKNIGSLEAGSVALNQTVGAAVVALAEADPENASQGHMHYVVFMPGPDGSQNMQTYMFTENITVNDDGSITSQMEDGEGWEMRFEEVQAYTSLVNRFADVAVSPAGQPSLLQQFEASSGRDLAVGGTQNSAGEVEIVHREESRLGRDFDVAAGASATQLFGGTTGFNLEVGYAREQGAEISQGVEGQMRLEVFRENLAGAVQEVGAATADGPDSTAKFERNQSMTPGIYNISGP